jgi:hypothetical protein
VAFETGMKWQIGENVSLYTGAYCDYGLNSVAKNANQPFINYSVERPSEFTANSVLTALTSKVNIITAGIKVRLAFN